MSATDFQELSTLFPTITRIHEGAAVSPASPAASGRDEELERSVDDGRVVHVGDVVRFLCEGIDPRGRELRWWLHPYGYDPTFPTVGNQVELRWTVGAESVGEHHLDIGMAADAEYHRAGGTGDRGWDGLVHYIYTVHP